MRVEERVVRDWERALEEGGEEKAEETCRVESSAKAWIREDGVWRRSLMKRRKRIGDRIEPCGTPLATGKEADVAPSTTTDIKRLERKLRISKQREEVKP